MPPAFFSPYSFSASSGAFFPSVSYFWAMAVRRSISRLFFSVSISSTPESTIQEPQGEKEETDTMKIDKSKMTPEEQAALAEFNLPQLFPADIVRERLRVLFHVLHLTSHAAELPRTSCRRAGG